MSHVNVRSSNRRGGYRSLVKYGLPALTTKSESSLFILPLRLCFFRANPWDRVGDHSVILGL